MYLNIMAATDENERNLDIIIRIFYFKFLNWNNKQNQLYLNLLICIAVKIKDLIFLSWKEYYEIDFFSRTVIADTILSL